jgi:FKBP-type peptidyl-prolyl cis-trans isomerase FkpA
MRFRIFLFYFLSFIISGMMVSCNNTTEAPKREINRKTIEEPLLNANKQAMKVEDEQIENYIQRHKWKMTKTGSGLRYAIYKNGDGPKAETGKIAVINYSVELISGEEIYSSGKDGAKEFLIGKGGVESGIEEGILLLHVGDHAKFIIPSHLGFGLIGDQNKVPPKSTLIYDIELLDLK